MKKFLLLLPLLLLLAIPLQAESTPDGYLVQFRTDISTITDTSAFQPIHPETHLYQVPDLAAIESLQDYVISCEPVLPVELIDQVPTVSLFSSTPADDPLWHLEATNATYAWGFDTYGNEVNVAVIDTGCSPHPAITHCLAGGYNYVDNTSDYSDHHGHGTHVAGIIGAALEGYYAKGVAPKIHLYALKCLEGDKSSNTAILSTAIYDAIDKYNCQVINLSLGTPTKSESLQKAIDTAISRGVIVVAAVGNDGTGKVYFPAGYEGVIGVGSINSSRQRSDFSQVNESVFAVAPGENVVSLYTENRYAWMCGTSQASPQVAGLAAVMLSADPTMTAKEFQQQLRATAIDLGPAGYDPAYGFGLIDTKAMLDAFFDKHPLYMSPINGDSVLLYNHGENTQNATLIRAEYSGERFVRCKYGDVTLTSKKRLRVHFGETSREVKFMLWDSIEHMWPLLDVRE